MRNPIPFLSVAILLFFASCHAQSTGHFEPVTVIELFTSEGCSSCPPADKLLSKVGDEGENDNKKVFTLSFHVDYWNRLGWKDPFSYKEFSKRQQDYANALKLPTIYTPQAIVNGTYELVGSDEDKMDDAMTKAAKKNATASFTSLKAIAGEDQKIHVMYTLTGDIHGCEVNFALVSLHESTEVRRGENSGRTLPHTHVVRQFISRTASAEGLVDFASAPLPAPGNMMVIAYIQRTDDLHIIGAAQVMP